MNYWYRVQTHKNVIWYKHETRAKARQFDLNESRSGE